MAFYVVIADQCQSDANRHAQSNLIANVKQAVESTQNLVGFSLFLPTPFLRKGLGYKFRLIAYRVPINDDDLILFLRVLARGSHEDNFFLDNWEDNTALVTQRFQTYSQDELRQIHSELSKCHQPLPRQRRVPRSARGCTRCFDRAIPRTSLWSSKPNPG